MKNLGLYIHIPFCVKKCNYCDFYSLGCPSQENTEEYVRALCTHIGCEGKKHRDKIVDTVFIGGGTPSVLSENSIKSLTTCLKNSFNIADDAEFSIEVNPGTVTKEKAILYRSLGINRVSMGLQSVNDNELKMLGRIHTFDEFKSSYKALRDGGIENINIDIMYALPNQKMEDLIKTVDSVCEFEPSHISAYCLKIEENTHFYKIRDTLSLPDEDEQYNMYLTLCNRLEKMGYKQYEISNFAKKGSRCVHNLKYWLSCEYVAFGPSAHSFVDGVRYSYKKDIREYVGDIQNGQEPTKILEAEYTPTEEEKIDEYVMLSMRLADGVNEGEFFSRFGISFIDRYPKLKKYEKDGYIIHQNGKYAFTKKGFFVSNFILSDILENI